MKNKIIIIGAGAAGLMAARTLSKAGKQVTVLEARNYTGGRIHTLSDASFFKHTELGAEFVHGNLPLTLKLLKKAEITYRDANAETWVYNSGKFTQDNVTASGWDKLLKRLNKLKTDTNIFDFIQQEFAGDQYEDLRNSIWKYVSGYDTADPKNASALALRNEWQSEEDNAQYRINGGYCSLINYLASKCKAKSGEIFLNAIVKEIRWKKGYVNVITDDGSSYEAAQVLIALPLGVLQAPDTETGTVTFHPPIPKQLQAISQMGFGAVIKVLLEFDTAFWLDDKTQQLTGANLDKMGFLLSDEEISTWWTQFNSQSTVLTGWVGGPTAADKKNTADIDILDQSLQSLANIFKRDFNDLKNKLISYRVMNWTADPFTRGSYAYDTIEAPKARKVLNKPIDNTLFFAGEYLYTGTAMGTVEAALTSGKKAAKKILKH